MTKLGANSAKTRIYDNGGKTIDRFTVIIGNSFFAMGDDVVSPQGFNQYCGEFADGYKEGKHLGKRVTFRSLPHTIQAAIINRQP